METAAQHKPTPYDLLHAHPEIVSTENQERLHGLFLDGYTKAQQKLRTDRKYLKELLDFARHLDIPNDWPCRTGRADLLKFLYELQSILPRALKVKELGLTAGTRVRWKDGRSECDDDTVVQVNRDFSLKVESRGKQVSPYNVLEVLG